MPQTVRCVVACYNANGAPDFYFVKVVCSLAKLEDGEHYEAARAAALSDGYEGPYVVFDEYDGLAWLFEHFEWQSASIKHVERSKRATQE